MYMYLYAVFKIMTMAYYGVACVNLINVHFRSHN